LVMVVRGRESGDVGEAVVVGWWWDGSGDGLVVLVVVWCWWWYGGGREGRRKWQCWRGSSGSGWVVVMAVLKIKCIQL
jgi:hypothetical protein